jgi:hypothetical protein
MNVMKRAWEIAKEGHNKFGGKVKEYFAVALKMAWTEKRGVNFKEQKAAERIILIADHDKKEYTVAGERNGKVFWKREGIAADNRSKYAEAYGYLLKALDIHTVSFYVIKNGVKTFLETKEVA